MHIATINETVRTFITQNFLFGQDLAFSDSDSFQEQGIIDSTGVLELVAFLEETYGIRVDDDELTPENLDTLANIIAYVSRKVSPALSWTEELRRTG